MGDVLYAGGSALTLNSSCDTIFDYYGSATWGGGYMQTCLNQYNDYGFQQGIDGFLTDVDSVTVYNCSKGDYRAWFQIQLCCPGECTRGVSTYFW